MLMRNESAVLVAEVSSQAAARLETMLRRLGHRVRTATSVGQTLEIVRREIVAQAVVAAELHLAGEPILARLSVLPALRRLVAVGPAGRPDVEIRARRAGADAYLARPVHPVRLATALGISVSAACTTGRPEVRSSDRISRPSLRGFSTQGSSKDYRRTGTERTRTGEEGS